MDLKEYQEQAKRTNAPIENNYKYMTQLHMLMGLQTEVGELTDVFKKHLAYNKEIDWVNVGEEVADIMWYLVNFCSVSNIDIGKELDKNIKKLKARFPENFCEKRALNRDLKVEREILEIN